MKTRHMLLSALALGCAVVGVAPTAEAQGNSPPQAEVLVIHATECDKPNVDPAIGEMPPLKYNCYKLLDKKNVPLTKGQSSTTPLPRPRRPAASPCCSTRAPSG